MESEKEFIRRKTLMQTQWEWFASQKMGLGDKYTIGFSKKGSLKAIKLDGNHVENLLKENAWKEGLRTIGAQEDTKAVWEGINI